MINTPLQFLLNLIRSLLTDPLDISLFGYFWAIIIYVISLFYGLLIVYVGFYFMFSGYNVIRREEAKGWLKRVIIMILLIQSSYLVYELFLQIASLLSTGVMSLIDNNFFLLTGTTFISFGLELAFTGFYLITLLITLLLLTIRYICVGLGLILFPLGIFLYFIPPLQQYGKTIINLVGTLIFMPFFFTLILLTASLLLTIPLFVNVKMLIMIAAFSAVNLAFFLLLLIPKTQHNGNSMKRGIKVIANHMVHLK